MLLDHTYIYSGSLFQNHFKIGLKKIVRKSYHTVALLRLVRCTYVYYYNVTYIV